MEKMTRKTAEKIMAKYPDVLDVAATTKILNLCKTRVNELIADSLIPAIRIGRKNFIAKESLIDYLCNGYKAQRVKIQLNNLKNNCHNSIDKLTSVSI